MTAVRKFKIVVLGDEGTGKSAFVAASDPTAPLAPRGAPARPPVVRDPTLGAAFIVAERTHTLTIDDGSSAHRHQRVEVRARHTIYDLAGGARFRESAAGFLRGCDAVVLVYRDAPSLAALRDYWVPLVTTTGADPPPLYFVLGTHAPSTAVADEAADLADELGAELALEIDAVADGGWPAYDALTEISLALVTRTYDAGSPVPVAPVGRPAPASSRCSVAH